MRKLSLKTLNLREAEVLTRNQLKKVLGGQTAVTTTPYYDCPPGECYCQCPPSSDGTSSFGFCATSDAQCNYVCGSN